jgi:peptidoglycan/xylan/chitin deacetylase (PgdA/CDA1 family)
MSWTEARQLRAAGFDIGAHTVNHALLSRMPMAEAEREIIESRSRILAEIGSCSATFCYPNGKRRDYSPEVRDFCGRHFAAALSTEAGAARQEDLYELRRVVVDNRTTAGRLASRVLQAA